MNREPLLRIVQDWSASVARMDISYRELVCSVRDEMIDWPDYENLSQEEVGYLVSALESRHRIEQAAGITHPSETMPSILYDDLGNGAQRAALGRFEAMFMGPEMLLVKDAISHVYPPHASCAVLTRSLLQALSGIIGPAIEPGRWIISLTEPISTEVLLQRWAVWWAKPLFARMTVGALCFRILPGTAAFAAVLPLIPALQTPAQMNPFSLLPCFFEFLGLVWQQVSDDGTNNSMWALDGAQFERWRDYAQARMEAGIVDLDTDDSIMGTVMEQTGD